MEKLNLYEKVFSERCEKEITGELTLPEYLPNVSGIIRVLARPIVDACENNGGVSVKGRVAFTVMYASEFESSIKCASFTADLSHTFKENNKVEDITESFPECKVSVYGESGRILSPRRIALSCNVILDGAEYLKREAELFDIDETDSIRKRTSREKTLWITRVEAVDVRVEESIPTSEGYPAIKEIVFTDCSFGRIFKEIKDGKCKFYGDLSFFCMYLADGTENDGKYVSLTKEIPFSVSVDIGEKTSDLGVLCSASIQKAVAESVVNSYGDSAGCRVEAMGTISYRVFKNADVSVCEDVFCTRHDCSVDVKELPTDVFVSSLEGNAEITGTARANIGSMTDTVSAGLTLNELRTEIVNGRVCATASGTLKITGADESGNLQYAECPVSFKHTLDEAFDPALERYRIESEISVDSPVCKIENGEVRYTFNSHLDAAALARSSVRAAVAIRLDDSGEYKRDKSRFIIYYPSSDDTVWTVAKKYKVAPEELVSANDLKGNDKIDKPCLVIPR